MLGNRNFETERKLWLLGAVVWSGQNGQRRLGHAVRHLTDRESVYRIKADYPGADLAE